MLPLEESDPKAIGPYRVIGLLGTGGMGRVYLAHSRSGRQVAIKVIRSDFAADPIFRERFAREVTAARSVSPLFTAAVVDADPQARSPWLATTFIDGISLDDRVANQGPMSPEQVFAMAAGLAEALASIHRAGLVHRDLKPGNILLNGDGPHVIDFGLALDPNARRMTSGIIVGTPSYMAPERLAGEEAGPPSDIFSLAATLYYAATGKELVDDASVYEQILQIKEARFDLDALPARLRPLIVRCISHEPRQRPTADELSRILTAMDISLPQATVDLSGEGRHRAPESTGGLLPPTPPPPPPRRWSRRRLLGVSAGVGVAVAAGGTFAAIEVLGRKHAARWAGGPPTPPPPLHAGDVMWTLDSGAAPPLGGPGRTVVAERIIVDAQGRIITSDGQQVYAKDHANKLLWVSPIPGSVSGTWLWGDAVLVTNNRQLWLFDAGTGAQRFATDPVTTETTTIASQPSTGIPVVVGQIVIGVDRAFVALGTATVAIGRDGKKLWRVPVDPGNGTPQAATPVAADDKLLICQDTIPALNGNGQVAVVSAYDVATGEHRWNFEYPLTASQPPGGPPPGGPPGDDPGPPPDNAWQRSEAFITPDAIAIRAAANLQVLSPTDGHRLWQLASPLPISQIMVAGDRLLIAADHLSAYDLGKGGIAWQNSLRGAHLAISTTPPCIVAVTEQLALGLGADGRTLWQTTMPTPAGNAPVDALCVNPHVVYVTFQAPDDHGPGRSPAPGPRFDLVAVALDAAG